MQRQAKGPVATFEQVTPIITVDAFTKVPFAGNTAAVCVLARARDERWMQQVAREMNLSETAFVEPEDGGYRLRWFTPTIEVDLCGHATLASAHVLWEEEYVLPEAPIRFQTHSGPLVAVRAGDAIELDFPATPPSSCEIPAGLIDALGARPVAVQKSRFDYLVELGDEAEVRGLSPDLGALRKLAVRGVMITARGQGRFDVVSRFFAPASGVNEDPVTGSAHCALGPYWARKLGKPTLRCYQASTRGGIIEVEVAGERVLLRGRAVTIMRGDLLW